MNKKFIEALYAGRPGVPVLISDLRKKLSVSKRTFDADIRSLAKDELYIVSRYAQPLASLSDAEKAAMVPDGKGRYYDTICPKYDLETVAKKLIGDPETSFELLFGDPETTIKELIGDPETVLEEICGVSLTGPGRGGIREGAGRPAKKITDKRRSLTVRLPVWLIEYLDGKAGQKIEAALIAQYGLTAPAE